MNLGFLSRTRFSGLFVVGVLMVFGGISDAFGGAPPARPLAENFFGQTCMGDTDCLNTSHCVPNPDGGFPGTCYVPKNRYLSIVANPTNNGSLTARRVSILSVDGPVRLGWVSQATGDAGLVRIASVTLDPHYTDWNTFAVCSDTGLACTSDLVAGECPAGAVCCAVGETCAVPAEPVVVHVGGCEIRTGNGDFPWVYQIESIALGQDTTLQANYSPALELRTTFRYGDVVGPRFPDGSPGPPDCVVNLDEMFSASALFTGPPLDPRLLFWFDIAPQAPDGLIGFADIFSIIPGVQGDGSGGYPFVLDPCACGGVVCTFNGPPEIPGASCSAIQAGCGNGALDIGEQCDDGNNNAGDGCDEFCQDESSSAAVAALVPVRASGVECAVSTQDPATCDWFLDGGTIRLHRGGQTVDVELRVSDWGAASLTAYQAALDCTALAGSTAGLLQPIETPCGTGPFTGCVGLDLSRTDRMCDGAEVFVDAPSGLVCAPGSIGLRGIDLDQGCPGAGDGTVRYGGQFAVLVPDDALGTFELTLDPDPRVTSLRESQNVPVAPVTIVPALIVTPDDCNGNGVPDLTDVLEGTSLDCNNTLSPDECDVVDGTSVDANINGVPDECDARPLPENYFGTCRLGKCAVNPFVLCASDLDCEDLAPPIAGNVAGIFCGTPGGTQADADQDCRFAGPGILSQTQAFCISDLAGAFPGRCYVAKNRYVSINPNPLNAGTLTARRVSFTPPGGVTSQVVGWVGPPVEKVGGMFPPLGFPNEEPNFFVSSLESSPHFMDWNTVGGTVHLTGCGIRPGFGTKFCTGDNATPCSDNDGCTGNGICSGLGMLYGIQSVPQGANLASEASYSVPLGLRTVAKYGDVAGSLLISGQLLPPENNTGLADVFAVLTLFTTVNEAIPLVWADLTLVIPDQFIGLADIFGAVNGFTSAGTAYPFTADPCNCAGGCPPPGS